MGNPWFTHLAKFRKAHPNLSPTQVMKDAKKTYTKVGKTLNVAHKTKRSKTSRKSRKSRKPRKSRKSRKSRK